jgi:hypothetical protein
MSLRVFLQHWLCLLDNDSKRVVGFIYTGFIIPPISLPLPWYRYKESRSYAPGDKVIQTIKDYDKDTFNGDIGQVTRVVLEEGEVVISFDGREVTYDMAELDEAALAYATTVYKSQGSEYPAIVIPLAMQHYPMLARNLLYTGVTRGQATGGADWAAEGLRPGGSQCAGHAAADQPSSAATAAGRERVTNQQSWQREALGASGAVPLRRASVVSALTALLPAPRRVTRGVGHPVRLRGGPGARGSDRWRTRWRALQH